MPKDYKEFNAADYVKTEADVRELLRAATDEDLGDGNRDSRRPEARRPNPEHECPRPRHRAKSRQPLTSFPRRRESRGVMQTGTRRLFGLATTPISSCAKNPLGLRLHLEPVGESRTERATGQTPESPGRVDFDVAPQSTPSAPSTPKCSPRVPSRLATPKPSTGPWDAWAPQQKSPRAWFFWLQTNQVT